MPAERNKAFTTLANTASSWRDRVSLSSVVRSTRGIRPGEGLGVTSPDFADPVLQPTPDGRDRDVERPYNLLHWGPAVDRRQHSQP